MEILRVISLIGFLIFITQITFSYLKLKGKGIPIIHSKSKSLVRTIILTAFFILFTAELIIQSFGSEIQLLPNVLTEMLHQSKVITVVGVFVIILSDIAIYFSLKRFSNSLRFGLEKHNLGKLITNGVFARTRNPFFISLILHFTGIALIIPSVFFVAIALLSTISIHFFILKEEYFMLSNYGEEYREYCKKVRRYF